MVTHPYSEKDFQEHLAEEHALSPFSEYLREIVYGGNDGIVTTFAVVAGFAGAGGNGINTAIPSLMVLLFGLANLFADATSMSLGNFLSLNAEQDVYRKNRNKELHEIRTNETMEFTETLHILKQRGFSEQDSLKLATIYKTNHPYWVDFMMNQELEIPNPEKQSAIRTSLATFFSFTIFGFVPLLPYIFFRGAGDVFILSVLFTAAALILLGLLRYRVTHVHIIRSVGEVLLLGGVASAIAYFVGTFFRL